MAAGPTDGVRDPVPYVDGALLERCLQLVGRMARLSGWVSSIADGMFLVYSDASGETVSNLGVMPRAGTDDEPLVRRRCDRVRTYHSSPRIGP
jgi:hypothetical protein